MGIKAAVFTIGRFLKRYWYLVFLFILLGGGAAYWIWKLEPEIDLADIKTKQFHSKYTNLSMTIPAQWEILSEKTLLEKIDELKPEDKQDKKFFEFVNSLVKQGVDFICCNFGEKFIDSILVQKIPLPGEKFNKLSDDEIRFDIKQATQGGFGFNTEIYEIKRLTN